MSNEGETRDDVPGLTDIPTGLSKRHKRERINGRKTERAAVEPPVLHISEVSFNLSTAASAARRTLPYVILATCERKKKRDAPRLHINDVRSAANRRGLS